MIWYKLADELSQIVSALPSASIENFQQWWRANGDQWTEQFRKVMIKHCNIGFDWQLADAQSQQLRSYYYLNKFLVELIEIKGAVTDTVRAEIEDTLLLPWEELQHHQM